MSRPHVPAFRRPGEAAADTVIGPQKGAEGPHEAPATPRVTPAVVPVRQEKITVYFTDAELAEIDLYRLELRARGLRVDRGRLIRAAIVRAMADRARLERAIRKGDGA